MCGYSPIAVLYVVPYTGTYSYSLYYEKTTHEMYFSLEITQLQWTLLQAALILTLAALIVFTARILAVKRAARRSAEDEISDSFENVAVIIYSNDDAGDLAALLPRILGQDYPADFEIIVVNEGDSPSIRETVSELQMTHSNLYLTSTPDGARNLSRKKLAITLGIKAARMPVVVLTTAGTTIQSDKWLRTMCRHFITGSPTEIVLGYAAPPPYEDKAPGMRARSFDHVVDSAAWISPAIKGRPWRGTGHNIAYRRELFFRNKGFSRHLNLRDGDDDIFVSEITRAGNTMIELSPEACVEVPGANSPRAYRHRMARRRFTERFISRRPHLAGSAGFASYMLAPLPALAAAAMSPANIFGWAACAGVLVLWCATGMIWRQLMTTLNGRRLMLTLPLLAATRPLRKTYTAIRCLLKPDKRYTWE